MTEIEGPNGEIFEFPDGTSDDVIKQAMARQFPAGANSAQPQAQSVAAAASSAPVPAPSAPQRPSEAVQAQMAKLRAEGFNARTPGELEAAARSLVSQENVPAPNVSRGGAFAAGIADAGLALPGVKTATAGLANLVFGGGVSADDVGDAAVSAKKAAREEHPLSTLGGDIVGFAGGVGGALYKGAAKVGGPLLNRTLARVGGAGSGSRAARYGGRLGALAVGGAAETTAFNATTGARNIAADEGRSATLADRASETNRSVRDPLSYAALPGLSLLYRGGRKALTGTATPRHISEAIGTSGRTAIGQAVGAGSLNGSEVQSVELVQRLLKNAGISDDRIAQGLDNISAVGQGERADLATLIDREFSQEAPGVAEGLRSVILRAGIRGSDDTREVLKGRIDDLRSTQADDFRQQAANELGEQPRFEAGQEISGQLDEIGKLYDSALAGAPRQGQQADAALQAAQSALSDVPSAQASVSLQALRQNVTPEEYVQRNPFEALHHIQKDIKSADLGPVRQRLQTIIEQGVPDYAAARQEWARVAGARDALGHFKRGRSLGDAEQYQRGFGDTLVSSTGNQGGATRTALGEAQIADQYRRIAAGDDQTLAAANLSIRDALTDPLRGTKSSGVDEVSGVGTDTALARFGALQSEGVVDALPNILGEKGGRLANRLRGIIRERQYLADIDPRVGSNTVNKAEAVTNGDRAISRGLGRVSDDGFNVANVSQLPKILQRFTRPRQGQQDRLAELLTRRADGTPSATPSRGRRGLFGGRPAAAADEAVPQQSSSTATPQIQDDFRALLDSQPHPDQAKRAGDFQSLVDDAVAPKIPHDPPTQNSIAGAGATPVVGAGVGAVVAPDADGDGTVSAHERAGGALGGALTASGVRAGARGLFGRGGARGQAPVEPLAASPAGGRPPKGASRRLESARKEGYEGASIDEAEEWRIAAAKGLDMSTDARMARAREMGFNTDNLLYHGTDANITEFSPARSSRFDSDGIFLSSNSEISESYARSKANASGKSEIIYPVFVRGDIADKKTDLSINERHSDHLLPGVIRRLKSQGKTAYRHALGEDYFVFDPSNIRSIHAAFDPDRSGSTNILAGFGGVSSPLSGAGVGAGIGSAAPAENNQERLRNAAIGAGVGLFGGRGRRRSTLPK